MTASEFKAWLEGFAEGIQGLPNEKQWNLVLTKAAKVHADPAPYLPIYPTLPSYPTTPTWKPEEIIIGPSTVGPAYVGGSWTS